MGVSNAEKGIYNIGIFITADALLTAVLTVWAQLWVQPSLQVWSKYYEATCGNIGEWFDNFNQSASFGLLFTYSAILCALVALAWAVGRNLINSENRTSDFAIGLFSASLIMGLVSVAQSILSVLIKVVEGGQIYQPLEFDWANYFLYLIFPIIGLSFWGAVWLNSKRYPRCIWKHKQWRFLPWYILTVILVIAFVIAILLYF